MIPPPPHVFVELARVQRFKAGSLSGCFGADSVAPASCAAGTFVWRLVPSPLGYLVNVAPQKRAAVRAAKGTAIKQRTLRRRRPVGSRNAPEVKKEDESL